MIGALLAKRAIRSVYAAMSRRDLAAIVDGLADDVVLEMPGHSVMSGQFEGKELIAAWFTNWFDHVSTIQFRLRNVAIENIFALGGSNVILVEWEAVERGLDGKSYRLSGISRLRAKGGKLVANRDYFFNPETLDEFWAAAEKAPEPESVHA